MRSHVPERERVTPPRPEGRGGDAELASAPRRARAPQPRHSRRRRFSLSARRRIAAWTLVTPALGITCVFFLIPLGLSIWISLNNWPLLGPHTYAGTANYEAALHNEQLKSAIVYTVVYTALITVALFAVGGALVTLVQRPRPAVGFFRTVYFLPVAIGVAASSLLWYLMFNDQVGIFSAALQWLHVTDQPVEWLGTRTSATFSVIVMMTWKLAGLQMIVLLVGLQAIPEEIFEAARVDGAARWAIFRRITLPLLRPTIALLLVLTVTAGLLAFDQFYILTGGGPDNTTLTLVFVIYRQAFSVFQLGSASAIAVLLLIALVVLNVGQLAVLRRRES